jgi:6-phosphogluconolactonase
MTTTRRNTFRLLALALALCTPAINAGARDDEGDDDDGFRSGKVFTSTNAVGANELLVYAADPSGQLTLRTRLATQGQGTAGGLGNQGAVTLSRDGRYIFVINALSSSVSTFRIRRGGLTLESVVDSGGQRPVSVTEHQGAVYVLNAGGAGNVAGFRNLSGTLKPLTNGVGALSASGGTGPAQVGFSPDGDALLVTEKATNKLTSYRVRSDRGIDAPLVTTSSGMTPFGFAFDRRGHALISEAFGGAANASAVSSYGFDEWAPAQPVLISPSVADTQSAACWVVVTPNGRHAYVTNTASGTVSSFAIQRSGKLALASAVAASAGAGPIDAAIAPTGRELFVLNAGSHTISSFSIESDGSLANAKTIGGLPAGATGLAAN